MYKFVKLTVSAIVALLVVGAISSVQGLDARAAKPEVVNIVARSKGLPPIVARQEPYTTPADATSSTTDSTSAKTSSPAIPTDLIPKASPTGPVDTGGKVTAGPSATPADAGASYTPTGTGSLIPQWSSLIAGGSVPSGGQPSSPPALTSTPVAKATTPASSAANKIENGLMGVIIAGIISLFF